jgi:hypothetical protein
MGEAACPGPSTLAPEIEAAIDRGLVKTDVMYVSIEP